MDDGYHTRKQILDDANNSTLFVYYSRLFLVGRKVLLPGWLVQIDLFLPGSR